jgi:hypothetical protein
VSEADDWLMSGVITQLLSDSGPDVSILHITALFSWVIARKKEKKLSLHS